MAALLAALLSSLLLVGPAVGQTTSTPAEGIDNGNYNYQGSFEFGYRFVDTSGNNAIYDTFVNQQQGPRLLEQTLNMRSLNHQGALFDTLYFSSFGWGGDPENASRLRMSKNKWYNFNMSFRRDRNFWDYNLLANPLNPPNQFVQVNDTPHEFQTVRRMYDYNLTLLPQSAVRFRLGYSRNNMEGPALSSIHEGTDTVLFQNTRTLLDAYQAGVDVKVLPRTNISYDQFLQYYRGDTSWTDRNLVFQLSNATPVDAGIIYNPTANAPCANALTTIFTAGAPPVLKPTCNGYQAYSRVAPTRVSYPTEQLTLQSDYFRRIDLSARASYSSSDTKVDNFAEDFLGLLTRTNQRLFFITGETRAKRVVANADFGVTVRLTEKLRVIDTFRFSNFRIPGTWNQSQLSLFASTNPGSMLNPATPFDPAVCPADPAACPQHSSSSPADVSTTTFVRFLGQDSKYNTVSVEYDFSRRWGGRLGYRYGHRTIPIRLVVTTDELFYPTNANRGDCTGLPLKADGSCSFSGETANEEESVEVSEHSALFGIWARPTDQLRLNLDLELFSADHAPTRISPRNLQHYKVRVNYKPKEWMNVSGTTNILESRDNVTDILHREHNRNYGFTMMLNPKERYGFEFGYNYDDIFSTTNICYVITSTPPPNSTLCAGGPLIAAVSIYDNKINFGYFNIMFKPVKRVTANLGYNLTSTSGNTLILNPVQTTLGPLAFNFHKPSASVDVDLGKGVTWRTAWNYYDYNEKSNPGLLAARDFHSNSATLSLRYAF